jgi:hypothetical protein
MLRPDFTTDLKNEIIFFVYLTIMLGNFTKIIIFV